MGPDTKHEVAMARQTRHGMAMPYSAAAWIAGIAAVAVLCGPATSPLAQSPLPWTTLPGNVLDIAINDAARAYAVSRTGEALRWRATDQRWSKMSGSFVRITGAEGNRPWGVTDKGIVMRFNGLWWEPKGRDVVDVAGDAVGNVLTAGADGRIQRWEPLSRSWRAMTGRAKRIALDDRGNPWVITPDNLIYRYSDDQWQRLPGSARDIAVAADGTALIADAEGGVRVWRADTALWEPVPGITDVVAIAATPNGGAWAVRADGGVQATVLISTEDVPVEVPDEAQQTEAPQAQASPIVAPAIVAPTMQADTATAPVSQAATSLAPQAEAPSADAASTAASDAGGQSAAQSTASRSVSPSGGGGGSGDPAARTTAEEFTFTDTRNTAARVEIGKDGSVFALITGGSIRRWSNERRRLEDFPGQLTRLAVDSAGNPWGVTGLGRVFRHDGQTWRQVIGATASDIAIGADGSVVTADANSNLARYNPATGRFERISGRGVQVAVAPDGTPWTIRDDNVVQRCDTDPCTPVNQRARNISIGPDGSVFLVSVNEQLSRKRPGSDDFERVLVPGHTPDDVAAGPQGFPWIVSKAGKVIATEFFERDESNDRTLALRTTTETTGTGATAAVVSSQSSSGFTFTKNLRFDAFKSGDPDANLEVTSGIAVGQDNSVFIHDNSSVFEFNARTEKFEALTTTFPADVADVSTDADGNIWGLSNSAPATVYRIRGTRTKSYTVISGTDTPRNMAVDGDGTVYAAVGNKLYRKPASASRFTEFSDDSILYVALAAGGDIWIVNQSFKVQQWTGSKFENRPSGTAQSADDIAAGADGTVYIVHSNKLLRWNATNADFDEVNPTNVTASFNHVGVTSEGRPWGLDTSSGGGGGQMPPGGGSSASEDIFRAKD